MATIINPVSKIVNAPEAPDKRTEHRKWTALLWEPLLLCLPEGEDGTKLRRQQNLFKSLFLKLQALRQ